MSFRGFSRSIVIISAFLGLLPSAVMASVVMLNTRVIYPAEAQSQTLQFTNNDNIPYVMQMWADINNPASTPDIADAPFMAIPALFRIEPHTGQAVRLIFTGKDLPKDRESIFYLNVVQIPPKNTAQGNQNQMSVILRNRVKVFYRPKTLVGAPDKVAQQLKFSLKQESGHWILLAKNASAYYASVISASVQAGNRSVDFPASMIAPKTTARWMLKKTGQSLSAANKVKFTLVNDYGGQTHAETDIIE